MTGLGQYLSCLNFSGRMLELKMRLRLPSSKPPLKGRNGPTNLSSAPLFKNFPSPYFKKKYF
ncbi:MAG: hypothetical protein UW09_C0004G0159 [candidate division TM6 bacterium GW2011_GWF2_43_87]|nr:MAG: hypothetical protein UW09_C0004G0159 [candidate division TM6 bacterium GW2011_GWF2_43_87]